MALVQMIFVQVRGSVTLANDYIFMTFWLMLSATVSARFSCGEDYLFYIAGTETVEDT